jgi:hypothetical protein
MWTAPNPNVSNCNAADIFVSLILSDQSSPPHAPISDACACVHQKNEIYIEYIYIYIKIDSSRAY